MSVTPSEAERKMQAELESDLRESEALITLCAELKMMMDYKLTPRATSHKRCPTVMMKFDEIKATMEHSTAGPQLKKNFLEALNNLKTLWHNFTHPRSNVQYGTCRLPEHAVVLKHFVTDDEGIGPMKSAWISLRAILEDIGMSDKVVDEEHRPMATGITRVAAELHAAGVVSNYAFRGSLTVIPWSERLAARVALTDMPNVIRRTRKRSAELYGDDATREDQPKLSTKRKLQFEPQHQLQPQIAPVLNISIASTTQ